MSVASVNEISAVSPDGFEAAIREALDRANKTLRNIQGAWVKDMNVMIEDGNIMLRSSKAVHKSTSPMSWRSGSSSPHPRARFPIQLACCDARRLIYLVAVGEVHPG